MNNPGMHMVECVNKLGPDKFFEHTIEAIVRRQIQLDLLSRQQERLVKVVMVAVNCVSVAMWRFFVPGIHRNVLRARMEISDSMPDLLSRLYVICDSWATRAFYQTLSPWFPKSLIQLVHIYGGDYHLLLKNIIDDNTMAMIERTRYNFAKHRGANVISHEFVKDGNLITARKEKDIGDETLKYNVSKQQEMERPPFMYPTTGKDFVKSFFLLPSRSTLKQNKPPLKLDAEQIICD